MTSSDGPVSTVACTTCGTPAAAEARFCRHCGTPLQDAPRPPTDRDAPRLSGGEPSTPDHETRTMAAAAADPAAATVAAVPPEPAQVADPAVTTGRLARDAARPTATEGLVCPTCATGNPLGRELCAHCGVDLETGRTLPQPRPSWGEAATSDSRLLPPTAHRAWWVAPLAIVAVAAAILGGLWFAEIGPFASEPELPPASFAAERYPVDDDPVPLVLSDIATVTSRPPQGERTFLVEQMVDTDPGTAWHSHPPDLPPGVDEKVDLFLDEPAWLSQVVINNGDHADAAAYEAAGRVQRATLVMDGEVRMDVVLLDLGRQPQAVTLPEPVLTTTVRLEILEILPGSASESLAISDVELRGWTADPTDADLALRRADVRQAAGSFELPG